LTSESTCGTCFGFEVHSSLAFHYLRGGDGEPLHVELGAGDPAIHGQLLKKWEAPFEARLYEDGDAYRLWIAGSGWFDVDPRVPRIAVPEGAEPVRREEQLWGMPALLCFLARERLPLHAAAVEVDGEAILLGGQRTLGKSTLAAGFAHAGHRLLNEDLCCLDLSSGPAVLPGPAMLRVRPDVGAKLTFPFARQTKQTDDRRHLALDEAARGDCRPVPVRRIVFLQRSDNGVRVEPVPSVTAVRDLFSLSFRLPGEESRARCFVGVSDLARAIPVSVVHYPRRLEELPRIVEAIAALR
jgi:hypothetical protein